MRPIALAAPFVVAAVLGAAVLGAGPAISDDRDPTPAERSTIEAALRAGGYVSWGDMEMDDGVWSVTDARKSDGKVYDLDLDPQSLMIIKRDPD